MGCPIAYEVADGARACIRLAAGKPGQSRVRPALKEQLKCLETSAAQTIRLYFIQKNIVHPLFPWSHFLYPRKHQQGCQNIDLFCALVEAGQILHWRSEPACGCFALRLPHMGRGTKNIGSLSDLLAHCMSPQIKETKKSRHPLLDGGFLSVSQVR